MPIYVQDRLTKIKCRILNKPQELLADSGSQCSLISRNLLTDDVPLLTVNSVISGISNQSHNIEHGVYLDIIIRNMRFKHFFYVYESTQNQVLVGTNFLDAHAAQINYHTHQIRLYYPNICLGIPTSKQRVISRVASSIISGTKDTHLCYPRQNTILAPLSATPVRLNLKHFRKRKSFFFSPNSEFFQVRHLQSSDCLVSPHSHTILIQNHSTHPIFLTKYDVIGEINPKFEFVKKVKCIFQSPDTSDLAPATCNHVQEDREDELQKRLAYTKTRFRIQDFDINPKLSPTHRSKIEKLLYTFRDCFAYDDTDIGVFRNYEHRLVIDPSLRPFYHRGAPIPCQILPAIAKQLENLVQAGVLRRGLSPFSSRPVLVRKSDGSYRLCLDLRHLNQYTARTGIELPPMREVFTKLKGKTSFTSTDIKQSYFVIKLHPDSQQYISFAVSGVGSFVVQRIPMGLKSSSAALGYVMQRLVDGMDPQLISNYADDLLVHTETTEKGIDILLQLFQRLRETGIRIGISKLKLLYDTLEVLGHRISVHGIQMSDKIKNSIRNYEMPKNKHDLRRLLGLCNFCRLFVKRYAETTAPLYSLLRKHARFKWTDEHTRAFQTLRQALLDNTILAHYDPQAPIRVYVDASSTAAGATVLQFDDSLQCYRPLAFISRRLSPAEMKYGIYEKELAGLVYALKSFRYLLLGIRFELFVDNKALSFWKTAPDKSGKLARFLAYVSEFDFTIEHVSSSENLSDAMTRNVDTPYVSDADLKHEMPALSDNVFHITDDFNIRQEQLKDPFFRPIIDHLENTATNTNPKVVRQCKFYTFRHGILYRVHPDKNKKKIYQLCLPVTLRNRWFYELHVPPLSGHMGMSKMYKRATRNFYFPDMRSFISQKCRTCETCQRNKPEYKLPPGSLLHHPILNNPFSIIELDVSGPYNTTIHGFKFIISAVDTTTKFLVAKALKDQTAESIVSFLYNDIVLKYGAPVTIRLDKYPAHTSHLFKEMCTLLKIKLRYCPSFVHSSIGLIETMHHKLQSIMKHYVLAENTDWTQYLQSSVFCLNNTPKTGLPHSANFLLYGYQPRDNVMINFEYAIEFESNKLRLDALLEARQKAIDYWDKSFHMQKRSYDKRKRQLEFFPGQRVLIYNPNLKNNVKAFSGVFEGPFEIIEKLNDNAYKVRITTGRNKIVDQEIAIQRLRAFHEDPDTHAVKHILVSP